MKTVMRNPASSDTYKQIDQLPLSSAQRNRALMTLRRAQEFVENIASITNRIKYLMHFSTAKYRPRHEVAA